MEEMLARWIKETKIEFEKAKLNQNLYKMNQMRSLRLAFENFRDSKCNYENIQKQLIWLSFAKTSNMNSAKSLSELYEIINKMLGPIKAKQAVATAVTLIISDLQDEGIAIRPEILKKRIFDYVQDFVEASRNEIA